MHAASYAGKDRGHDVWCTCAVVDDAETASDGAAAGADEAAAAGTDPQAQEAGEATSSTVEAGAAAAQSVEIQTLGPTSGLEQRAEEASALGSSSNGSVPSQGLTVVMPNNPGCTVFCFGSCAADQPKRSDGN